MSVIEVETWTPLDGVTRDHDAIIREWFAFVRNNHDEMFSEWKSVRHYRELATDSRQPTGRYIMMFEFHTIVGRDNYKSRRKDWSGPYEEYRTVDPYQFFDQSSVTLEFWEPREESLWMDFPEPAPIIPPQGAQAAQHEQGK